MFIPMLPDELRNALDSLGLNQRAAASLLGVSRMTIFRWLKGSSPIPTPVALYLRLRLDVRAFTSEAQARLLPPV